MTRIFAVNVPSVKPTRRTSKAPAPFGVGILPSRPSYRTPCTLADVTWWTLETASAEDSHYDAMAAESVAMDRLEAGLLF